MSRILVTGCSGYIGRHLAPALGDAGHEVTGVDRHEPAFELADFHLGDLNEPGVAERAADGVDLVVHLAAAKDDWGVSAERYERDNVQATRTLIAAGRNAGVRRWLHYSTVGVYGPSDDPADETAPVRADQPYGRTKADAEALFATYAAEQPDG